METIIIKIPEYFEQTQEEIQYYILSKIENAPQITSQGKAESIEYLTSRLFIGREEAQAIAVAFADSSDDYCCVFSEYAFGRIDIVKKLNHLLKSLKVNLEIISSDLYKVKKACEAIFFAEIREEGKELLKIDFGLDL